MIHVYRWAEKGAIRRDAVGSQGIDAREAQEKKRPTMKKTSAAAAKQVKSLSRRQSLMPEYPRKILCPKHSTRIL